MSTFQEIINLLDEMDGFIVEFEDEYHGEKAQVLFGKITALRAYLNSLNITSIVQELDNLDLEWENLIPVLEFMKGYAIPESRRLLGELEEEGEIYSDDTFWDLLHPRVKAISKERFLNGHFADAVEAAYKEVNIVVKDIYKSQTGNEADGAGLMTSAFSVQDPVLVLGDLGTQNGRNIQLGYMKIFEGSIIGIRNPKAHQNLQTDRVKAIHLLYLASLLFTKIDERI